MPASDALSVGARVGRYEIVAFVDAGGMGEVYRARDTELGRVVAIKVLPAAAVDRVDRLHRFELEARAAAALNHPNILAIYDVGQHHGTPYLVTEWLDGTTLRTCLEGPPLPLRRAIEFGIQIADALAAAHARGVVHRDIKPENLFVTSDGRLKVLDFGLAKLADDDQTGRTKTVAGTVLGTLGYLSPEQASGQAADHRADIFSAGAVLFELVTHRRAFAGATPAEILAAVLGHDPTSEAAFGSGSRARVLNLVRRCLEKAPERRFQSAADLSMVLANELADDANGGPVVTAHGARRWRVATLAAVLLSGALAAVMWEQRLAREASPAEAAAPVHRLTIALPADLSLTYGPPIAISPDGAQIAVVMSAGDGQRLFVRRLDRDAVEEVPGTDGAEFPFFSPEGAWLGFWARNRLWRVPLRGGTPIALADSPDAPFRGADWSAGTILFAPLALGPLSQIETESGAVRPATALDRGREEYSHRWPQVLAGGGAWLYTALSGPVPGGTAAVMLHVPATGETRTLLPNASYARYVGDGLLVFVRDGQLFVTRFDAERFVVDGEPAPVPDPIASRSVSGATLVSVAADGSAAFVKSAPESSRTLLWVDRTGVEQPTNATAASYSAPRLSPDGRRVAVTIRGSLGSGDVWTIDLSTHVRTRLTTDGRTNGVVEWSPDSRRLIAGMPRLATDTSSMSRGLGEGPWNLFVLTADGVGSAQALLPPAPMAAGGTTESHPSFVGSWGRDDIVTFGYGTDLWSLRLGDRGARPILALPGIQVGPRVSPNGRWLAYVSNESGRFDAFLTTYPQPGRRWQVSEGGGQEVVWSRDSRELYFRQHQRMMAVTIDAGGTPNGRPRAIFDGRYFSEPNNPGIPHFDIAADGRFLMVSSEAGPPDQVQLVLGWRSYLAGLLADAR